MDIRTGLFYLFSAILLFAAFRVVTARNPVYAALYLVLTFFQASAVWLLLKAEFLAKVAKGEEACGLVSRAKATELLGTMLGGFNIKPLIDLLADAEVGAVAAEVSKLGTWGTVLVGLAGVVVALGIYVASKRNRNRCVSPCRKKRSMRMS